MELKRNSNKNHNKGGVRCDSAKPTGNSPPLSDTTINAPEINIKISKVFHF